MLKLLRIENLLRHMQYLKSRPSSEDIEKLRCWVWLVIYQRINEIFFGTAPNFFSILLWMSLFQPLSQKRTFEGLLCWIQYCARVIYICISRWYLFSAIFHFWRLKFDLDPFVTLCSNIHFLSAHSPPMMAQSLKTASNCVNFEV